MRVPKYPLEPLANLREEAVDTAVRGLADAVTACDGAERRRQASERRRLDHEQAAAHIRTDERQALARGELRAADLATVGAWETRVASERATMEADIARAKDAEARAREAEQKAQADVTAREADAKVVENDRERWREAQRKKAETKEEEEAAEAFRPVR